MAKRSAIENFLGDMFSVQSSDTRTNMSLTDKIVQEYHNYAAEHILAMSSSPFPWWKSNSVKYPFLSKLAKQLLVIQATSVSSERVFSTAGDVVSEKRARLKPESVDKLVFLNKNNTLLPERVVDILKQ